MKRKNGTDDIANPESKQEIAAQPYNSGKNAQFRSQPELYGKITVARQEAQELQPWVTHTKMTGNETQLV